MPRKDQEMLTLTQAAKEVGCDSSTLRRAIQMGKLTATRVGSVWIVTRNDLDKYIEAGNYKPNMKRR